MKTLKTIFIIYSILFGINSYAQNYSYIPTKENLENRKEFENDKFGIFIHWGIYSLFAQGEWYLHTGEINAKEYAKAASAFYPSKFNAKEWVSIIKESGAKYICFTSRHHDSFSMYHTQYSDYNIVDATPFKRDILKEISEECNKQGIKLHVYYSHLDWSREDYYPRGKTGNKTGRADKGEWESYNKFMNNQLTELLNNYGPIRAIWFDGMWDKPDFDWKLEEQYSLIHKIQPSCLIGNNHHKKPLDGEDFQMFEKDLPGENKAGYSAGTEIGNLPLETCETMNGMWGYKIKDQNYKSTKDIIRLLVRTAGKGANLLLNIGPQPNGELPKAATDRLKEVGKWLKEYGETIYSTSKGYEINSKYGTTTLKDNVLYVHLINDIMPPYIIIPIEKKIKSIKEYKNKKDIPYEIVNNGVKVYTESLKPDIDFIIEINLK